MRRSEHKVRQVVACDGHLTDIGSQQAALKHATIKIWAKSDSREPLFGHLSSFNEELVKL